MVSELLLPAVLVIVADVASELLPPKRPKSRSRSRRQHHLAAVVLERLQAASAAAPATDVGDLVLEVGDLVSVVGPQAEADGDLLSVVGPTHAD